MIRVLGCLPAIPQSRRSRDSSLCTREPCPAGGRRTKAGGAGGHVGPPLRGYWEGQQIWGNGRGRSPAPTRVPEVSAVGRCRHRPLRDAGDGASRTPPPTEGTGETDCRVGPLGLLAMTVFLSFRGAKRRGNPFLSQEGPALYMAGEEMRLSVMGHDCQGSAERSGERGDSSWSIRFLPDNLRVQHGVGGAED